MHFDLSHQFQPRRSPVHRLDPRVKVGVTVLFILTAGLMPEGSWIGFALLFLLVTVASAASRLGAGFTLRRSYVALPFALVALPLLVTMPGDPALPFPILGLTITEAGLLRFGSVLARSWVAVQGAILLTAVTPFPDLLWSFGALRMPRSLVVTIGFMVRYFFVLADEAVRMMRARAARSAASAGRRPGAVWQGRVAGQMVGSLFLRALERSERVHAAMLARGYDGRVPTLTERRMGGLDWGLTVGAALLLSGLLLWAGTI